MTRSPRTPTVGHTFIAQRVGTCFFGTLISFRGHATAPLCSVPQREPVAETNEVTVQPPRKPQT